MCIKSIKCTCMNFKKLRRILFVRRMSIASLWVIVMFFFLNSMEESFFPYVLFFWASQIMSINSIGKALMCTPIRKKYTFYPWFS